MIPEAPVPFGLQQAIELASKLTPLDASQFYGDAAGLSVGTGLLYDGIAFPVFNPDKAAYEIRRGVVLVLTHECDIASENKRPMNSDVIFAPLASFEDFMSGMQELDDQSKKSYVGHLVSGNISQLFYLPPWERHPNGSVLYFNRIGNTHVSQFEREGVTKLKSLSTYAHMRLSERLSEHLLRSKAEAFSH